MSRTVCVWIPQLELTARVATEPQLAGVPLLIADVSSPRARVRDASAAAQMCGVQPRLPLAAARSRCPDAVIIPPDPRFVRELRQQILAELYRFSPQVGDDGGEAFFLALAGLERLHADERALATGLRQLLARRFSLAAAVGIADSPTSAWIVARAQQCPRAAGEPAADALPLCVVPRGEDRTFLAGLPLTALPMPEEIVRLCRVLGLDRVEQLQQLPPGALLSRFGRGGMQLEARVRAHSNELFRIEVPQTIERSELCLDQPTADYEVLLFLHKNVLDRLLRQVAATRRALAALEITLVLADAERSEVRHVIRPPRPLLEARPWLELCGLWLQSGPATDLVDAIVMRAVEVGQATLRQLRLFEWQEDLAADALQVALARLVAALGREAVAFPRLVDRWLPEDRLGWRPAIDGERDAGQRAQERPQPVVVPVLSMLAEPLPVDLRGDRLRLAGQQRWRRLIARRGPYAVEGEWWAAGFHREYLLLCGADQQRYWVYREGRGWLLQGYLD